MRIAIVVGPTHATVNDFTGKSVPSFADAINAKLEELDAQGITSYSVDCKPDGHGYHYGYISYEPVASASVGPKLPKLLTIKQTAKHLNVSPWYVSDRIRKGELKAVDLGKRKMIEETEYLRFTATR
jgi:hypothetical protein